MIRVLFFIFVILSPIALAEDPARSIITGKDNSSINAMASIIGLSSVCMERGLYVTEKMVEDLLNYGEKEYGRFLYSDFFSKKVNSWEQAAKVQTNISNECLHFATEYNKGFNGK
ncbi:hypothetical protein [Vibrio vulnificus]|uniref:hypothetical protein n=1 Tax=Vibrio TaxID=662 RepID=UPI000DAE39A4|nr:hypothetical protein [Vibrio vulnificus]MDK2622641.1 hypothetical protein [Vibrio vulnificus]RAH21887.1 hypothetical protein DOT36_16085 [Vibrio vulnificus]